MYETEKKPPDVDSKDLQKKLKEKIGEHLLSTHVHGLPQIIRTKHVFIKALWILSFFSLATLCTVIIYKDVDEYFQRPILTEIREISETSTQFPAVTFCNKNPFLSKDSIDLVKKYLKSANSLPSYFADSYLYEDIFSAKLLVQLEIELNNLTFSDDVKKSLGRKLDETILDCSYNFEDCNQDDFTWHYSFEYGNCFTFNSKENSSKSIKIANTTGFNNGLYLELFTGMKEAFSVSKAYGALVFIHNQTRMFESSECLNLKPGSFFDVSIKKVFRKTEPIPYSQCHDFFDVYQFDKTYFNLLEEKKILYNQKDCLDLCVKRKILNSTSVLNYSDFGSLSIDEVKGSEKSL